MATIGTFTKKETGFEGLIRTLAFTALVSIEPVTRKHNDKSPDYRLYVLSSGPGEIGAAWTRTHDDITYLSVQIDDPIFPVPIQCRLIEADDEGRYNLVWERKRNRD